MKDVESRGKWFDFPWSAFHSQWGDHHVGCASEEGLDLSLYDLSLEWPQADALPYHNKLIDTPFWGSPTGTFNLSLCTPRGRGGYTPSAGKQLCRSHSGPWHGETVYLTLLDNIDYSSNRTGPYDQGNPLSKVRLIGYHKENHIFIIACDPPYLHAQDDEPKRTSMFPA